MFNFFKRLFGAPEEAAPPPRPNGSNLGQGYAPRIASAEPLAQYDVAGRKAILLGNIVPAGLVEYLYILVVYGKDDLPCLFVASEVNTEQATLGGGSHFLGVFPGDGHLNFGAADEWADQERFVERALALAREHLEST